MFDFNNMMGKIKEVQAKVKEAQEQLVNIEVTAEAGAGMVKATANGAKQLINVEIDKDLIKPEEQGILQDLVVAAVNKALEKAEEQGKETMQQATQGVLPNIPGLDLGKFT